MELAETGQLEFVVPMQKPGIDLNQVREQLVVDFLLKKVFIHFFFPLGFVF